MPCASRSSVPPSWCCLSLFDADAGDSLQRMGHHRFSGHVNASREQVFDLWVNPDRIKEWIVSLTRITDVTGPTDEAGTRYTAWFGRSKSPTKVLDADRPRLIRTPFRQWSAGRHDPDDLRREDGGTLLTEAFSTEGFIPGIAGRAGS